VGTKAIVDSSVTLATGITLSYAQRGAASGPTVVMLPGPTDSWHSYRSVLERLPTSMRAVAVSQRGHGDSEKPAIRYRVEDCAADAVALLEAVDIGRGVLAGPSGSCLVAGRGGLAHPGAVAGLILEASPATLRRDARLVGFVASVVSELQDPIDPEVARS